MKEEQDRVTGHNRGAGDVVEDTTGQYGGGSKPERARPARVLAGGGGGVGRRKRGDGMRKTLVWEVRD